jgi:hypothetical protein
MIIDLLENFYRKRAEPKRPINVFRASRAGHCERAMGYDELGIEGDPITPRRAAVFRHGTILDGALKADLAAVLGDRFVNLDDLPVNLCEIEGVRITFTPDGAFQADNGDIGIIEIKTMSDFGFERALKGEIDRVYLCQAWTYAYGTSFNPVVFVCYRKETSHFCEVIFDRTLNETVVTQRFGGDAKQLYTSDPLLIAEISTPFDSSVEEEVRGKFRRLAQVEKEADLAAGVRKIEPETVNVQGAANAAAYANAHGLASSTAVKSGSWFKFHTGRQIAGFPCNYCSHIRRCLGAELEFTEANKPLWVIKNDTDGREDVGGTQTISV